MSASRPVMYFWMKGSSLAGMVWAISSHSSFVMAILGEMCSDGDDDGGGDDEDRDDYLRVMVRMRMRVESEGECERE